MNLRVVTLACLLAMQSCVVLAVRVQNIGRNSRWYSGSGIYRHVLLEVTDPLRVAQWGVSVTTSKVTARQAAVHVTTTIVNGRNADTAFTLRVKLVGQAGKILRTGETNVKARARARVEVPLAFQVKSPPLWSTASPLLCQARVELSAGGKTADSRQRNI